MALHAHPVGEHAQLSYVGMGKEATSFVQINALSPVDLLCDIVYHVYPPAAAVGRIVDHVIQRVALNRPAARFNDPIEKLALRQTLLRLFIAAPRLIS